jgi:phosphoglycerol transferase MdoB-like AlkP superfamily enzyme
MIQKPFLRLAFPRNPVWTSLVLVLLTGVLFLPIRGGVTVSTMNISHAYFSDRLFLNHAAINPVFNFFYSLNKQDNFESQYQFYDKDEAELIFKQLHEQPGDTIRPSLLRVDRPNIILFILESFSYPLTVDTILAPNLSRFAKEGILFENFYANSFRTDRGLTAI